MLLKWLRARFGSVLVWYVILLNRVIVTLLTRYQTKEVGMDFKNMGAKRVCVVTDSIVRNLNAMKQVEEGLTREGVEYFIYDGCRVEPKDSS